MTQGQLFEVGELLCVAERGEAWQAGSKRERILVGELQAWGGDGIPCGLPAVVAYGWNSETG